MIHLDWSWPTVWSLEQEDYKNEHNWLLKIFKTQNSSPSLPEGKVHMKSLSQVHIYRSFTNTLLFFPPWQPHLIGDPGALPGAGGVCPGLSSQGWRGLPSWHTVAWPHHKPQLGSGSGRPPTPSLFAKFLSFTCTGSRKVVTSWSRNGQQARSETHEGVWVTGCLWFSWPHKPGLCIHRQDSKSSETWKLIQPHAEGELATRAPCRTAPGVPERSVRSKSKEELLTQALSIPSKGILLVFALFCVCSCFCFLIKPWNLYRSDFLESQRVLQLEDEKWGS